MPSSACWYAQQKKRTRCQTTKISDFEQKQGIGVSASNNVPSGIFAVISQLQYFDTLLNYLLRTLTAI